MPVADKIIALLDTMTAASLDALPPARRRQFADLCRYWAGVADRGPSSAAGRPKAKPKAGVLFDLQRGQRVD